MTFKFESLFKLLRFFIHQSAWHICVGGKKKLLKTSSIALVKQISQIIFIHSFIKVFFTSCLNTNKLQKKMLSLQIFFHESEEILCYFGYKCVCSMRQLFLMPLNWLSFHFQPWQMFWRNDEQGESWNWQCGFTLLYKLTFHNRCYHNYLRD